MADNKTLREIHEANQRFYRAFESLDIKQMDQVWAQEDLVYCVHPGWDLRAGWPAVRDSWVQIFNYALSMRFAITAIKVNIEGDCAWVTCMEYITSMMDGSPQYSRVLATNIFKKQGEQWRMVHHHGSPVFRAASPEALKQ
jgi:ketosteroid isomerase-like protein